MNLHAGSNSPLATINKYKNLKQLAKTNYARSLSFLLQICIMSLHFFEDLIAGICRYNQPHQIAAHKDQPEILHFDIAIKGRWPHPILQSKLNKGAANYFSSSMAQVANS